MKTYITSQIPIFITARGNNEIAVKKNKEALLYSYILIKNMNLFDQTYIISDNIEMIKYAKELGFIHFVHNECKNEFDINFLDYIGIYNFWKKTGYKPDWFILLAIGQLFKDSMLIYDCIRNIDNNYDIIASYTVISNRSSYFIKDNHIVTSGHLITHERDIQKMIDSTIYAINTDFAINCVEKSNGDPSAYFWNGRIKFFENKSIYTDIKNIEDINKYYKIGDIIDKVKKIKKERFY